MFLDASAMVAMLVEESDAASLTKRLEQAVAPCTSPIATARLSATTGVGATVSN